MNEDLDKHRFPQKVRNALLRFIDILAVRIADEIFEEQQSHRKNANSEQEGGQDSTNCLGEEKT